MNPAAVTEEREVAFFLATQNSITNKLRDTLEGIEYYDDVLGEIVNECISLYEKQRYVLASDKHMFLKVGLGGKQQNTLV